MKKIRYVIFLLGTLIISSCGEKPVYYEIPKSEVVDVKPEEQEKKIINEDEKLIGNSISYTKYINNEYGYSVDIPDFLKKDSGEEGVICFSNSSKDTTIELYSIEDVAYYYDNTDIDSIYEQDLANFYDTPTFVDKGDNWYVFKWQSEDVLYYRKYILNSDNTDVSLTFGYPKSKEKEYEEVLSQIEKTFISSKS